MGGGSTCADMCDCDGDGDKAKGVCGGKDCADHDKDAPAGADFDQRGTPIVGLRDPAETQDYDFDCDGVVKYQYPVASCGLLSNGLCGEDGFKLFTECGQKGLYIKCDGTLCAAKTMEMRIQGCH